MIKVSIALCRNPALTQQQFAEYHRQHHAPLFMSIPVVQKTVRRYVQTHSLELTIPGLPMAKHDGLTELWFDSVENFSECFTDEEYMRVIRPDEVKFLDLNACEIFIGTENNVYA